MVNVNTIKKVERYSLDEKLKRLSNADSSTLDRYHEGLSHKNQATGLVRDYLEAKYKIPRFLQKSYVELARFIAKNDLYNEGNDIFFSEEPEIKEEKDSEIYKAVPKVLPIGSLYNRQGVYR